MNELIVTSFEISHIKDALDLLSKYYQNEKEKISILPVFSDYEKLITTGLTALAYNGLGIAIHENGSLQGFMAGYLVEELFGKEKGVFVPAFGHAASYSKRIEIEQMLYTEAAKRWVSKEIFTHSIAIFAHDENLQNTLFHLGFGNRCVDAIRQIQPQTIDASSITFEEITVDNASIVVSLHEQHHQHYRNSPIFMPNQDEDALTDLLDWISIHENRMFCVKYNKVVAGYIRYQRVGESLFSIHSKMRNITGLYVKPEFRHLKLGQKLLQYIESLLEKDQYKWIGVDYESINLNAYYFWEKYFTPYTYSLVRRIDERIAKINLKLD